MGILKNRNFFLAGIIILIMGAVAQVSSDFLSLSNIINIYDDMSILMILALGQMIVIITRCIDLSVAANLALTGMIVALINSYYSELPIVVLIIFSLFMGLVLGFINGFFVWKYNIPSIIVTLGTMSMYRGIIFIISGGEWVNAHEMSKSFIDFPRQVIFGISVMSWVSVLVVAILYYFMTFRRTGRYIYGVGSNPTAMFYSGVDTGKIQCVAFIISGAIAGLSGYFWIARYAVAYVDVALGFELQVIAACVIGGVSIMGGIGTIRGCALGVILLGTINNSLPIISISPFWQMTISGTVIILAVIANSRSEKTIGRIILRPKKHNHRK